MVSAGMSEQDFGQLESIVDAIPALQFICLDVANGYSEHFVAFVKRVRNVHFLSIGKNRKIRHDPYFAAFNAN